MFSFYFSLIFAVFICVGGVCGKNIFFEFLKRLLCVLACEQKRRRERTNERQALTHEYQQQRDGQQVGNELSSFNNGDSLLNLNVCKETI